MNQKQFKTDINCASCVARVTPFLNEAAGIGAWQIDTSKPEKPLTISNEQASEAAITEAVKKAGFKIDAL